MELSKLRYRLEQERGKLNQLMEDKQTIEIRLQENLENQKDIEEAQLIIQTVVQETQNQITEYISDLVSSALDAVFDNPYELKLSFVQRRGKTEADLKFIRDGHELEPLDESGGGVLNVASFALRVSLWSLTKSSRNVIVCDEPFHFLHNREAHKRVSELLQALSQPSEDNPLGLQIIMITGESESEELISNADRVFRLELVNGITKTEVGDEIHRMV